MDGSPSPSLSTSSSSLHSLRTTTTWHHHEAEFHYLVAAIAIWHQVKSTFRNTTYTVSAARCFFATFIHSKQSIGTIEIDFGFRQSDSIATSFIDCSFISTLDFYADLIRWRRRNVIRSFNHNQMNGIVSLFIFQRRRCSRMCLQITYLASKLIHCHCHRRRLRFNLGSLHRKFRLKPIGPRCVGKSRFAMSFNTLRLAQR